MRGCGSTDAPEDVETSEDVETYSCVSIAADMLALLDELGHDTAILVGHFWGAS